MERVISSAKDGAASEQAKADAETAKNDFIAALEDDFNTADAIAAIFEFVRKINIALSDSEITKEDVKIYLDEFNSLTNVLGLLYNKNSDEIPEEIKAMVEQRAQARKEKNFALADELRAKITGMGYIVEETRQGTIVKKA